MALSVSITVCFVAVSVSVDGLPDSSKAASGGICARLDKVSNARLRGPGFDSETVLVLATSFSVAEALLERVSASAEACGVLFAAAVKACSISCRMVNFP